MPFDASAAATDRPEPSGPAELVGREAGVTVPPPRSAPAVEADPAPRAAPPPAAAPTGERAAEPAAGSEPALVTDAGPVAASGAPSAASGAPSAASGAPSAAGSPRDGAPAPGAADGLTERERRILAFEQRWWKHAGAKEQAIRDTFGLSATRYYQLLNALLDHPAALAAEPVLIGRLRRLRSSRARNRRR